ncbi:hypothetical protein MTR67_005433 [Solanum verrucosum]|uniref:Uncharacterized protein n=1 Tax=Solanum verrucosum TaxID=315347 RepID=A0AAF0PWD5_SOLVR|nr:hypothetical protein MTR67_005433 [Solanum verrucosum]
MDQVKAIILVIIMNIIFPGVSIALSVVVLHGDVRNTFIGILCALVAIAMYASPLSVMVPNVVGLASGSAQLINYINV